MKLTVPTTLVFLFILTVGCQEENVKEPPDEQLMNRRLVTSYSDIAIQNAIISEHTLFPYHFVKNGTQLNELGRRDLAVLTGHFARNGGHLNIRQLGVSDELYEARVSLVRERLHDAHIDMARISTSDGMPGGSGMPSERVLVILEQVSTGVGAGTSTAYGSEMK